MGPTFIKLGQMLSTRPTFSRLHHQRVEPAPRPGPPFPWDEVREIIGAELGAGGGAFADFSREPLAPPLSARCTGAKLKTGEEVVVKVQRPRIGAAIETDLEILGISPPWPSIA